MTANTTAKKQGNWFGRHKVLTVILVLIILAAIGGASGNKNGTSDRSSDAKPSATNHEYRFADRADKQPKDVELLPNESGTVNGVKLTVASVQYATSLGDYDNADSGKTYVVADVTLENTSDRTQPYNEYDFRMQTAGGQVLDPTIVLAVTDKLNSGDIVVGGTAKGKVIFEIPLESGQHQYLIWKPSSLEADRAIVQTQ